jgi:hypothetical protein
VYEAGTERLLGYDEVRTDFSYRSKREPILHFGLNTVEEIDIILETQKGDEQRFSSLKADKLYELFI